MTQSARFDGTELQRLRKAQNWSLEDLARRSGVSLSHISQLEKGGRKSPSVDLVYRLAEALSISIYQLLEIPLPEGDERASQASSGSGYPLTTERSDEVAEDTLANWVRLGRRLHPDVLAFMALEDAEPYILFAKKLYDVRDSSAQAFRVIGDFLRSLGHDT